MRIMLKPLAEQTIVITGASSGIGLATARRAARAGARVMLAARSGEALQKICSELREDGGTAEYTVTDVSSESEVKALADATVRRFGGFDSWVNDAGVGLVAPIEQTSSADHHKLFETNYFGLVYGSLAAARHFRETGKAGAIINLGSVASDMPVAMSVAYAATKHAIKGFTDGLRIELARDKVPISVTLIKPSGIDTPFFDHAHTVTAGMGKAPGPNYSPDVVAQAILYAAEHVKRGISVGSTAAVAGVIEGTVPQVIDGQQVRMPITHLIDYGHSPEDDNLYDAAARGEERSRFGSGRGISVTTAAQTAPTWLGWTSLLAVAGLTTLLVRRKGRSMRDDEAALLRS